MHRVSRNVRSATRDASQGGKCVRILPGVDFGGIMADLCDPAHRVALQMCGSVRQFPGMPSVNRTPPAPHGCDSPTAVLRQAHLQNGGNTN
jgi:hypothetical protein